MFDRRRFVFGRFAGTAVFRGRQLLRCRRSFKGLVRQRLHMFGVFTFIRNRKGKSACILLFLRSGMAIDDDLP